MKGVDYDVTNYWMEVWLEAAELELVLEAAELVLQEIIDFSTPAGFE